MHIAGLGSGRKKTSLPRQTPRSRSLESLTGQALLDILFSARNHTPGRPTARSWLPFGAAANSRFGAADRRDTLKEIDYPHGCVVKALGWLPDDKGLVTLRLGRPHLLVATAAR